MGNKVDQRAGLEGGSVSPVKPARRARQIERLAPTSPQRALESNVHGRCVAGTRGARRGCSELGQRASQRIAAKAGQHKGGAVHIVVVVPAGKGWVGVGWVGVEKVGVGASAAASLAAALLRAPGFPTPFAAARTLKLLSQGC